MAFFSRNEAPTTNFKPVEPEVPEKIYPNPSGTVIQKMASQEPVMIIDDSGEIWIAKLDGGGCLRVDPAVVTPREKSDE